MRPGHESQYQDLTEIAVPVIECSLPSLAWLAEDLAVAGCLTLPITAQALLNEIHRHGQIKDILVIAHDRDLALLLERMLQKSGSSFEVHRAYDVAQGIATIQNKRPDLVLLDAIIPGAQGFSTLEQMRSTSDLAGTTILLLNAKHYEEEARRNGHFAVYQREGLYPTEVLSGLNAIISNLKPRNSVLSPSKTASRGKMTPVNHQMAQFHPKA